MLFWDDALVSEKSFSIIRELQCCPSIVWVPTTVRYASGSTAGVFWVAHHALQHNIWDYDQSDCLWIDGMEEGTPEAVGVLWRGVAKARDLPAFDLFWTRHRIWVARLSLVNAIVRAGLTGYGFDRLPLSVE